ncbi:hypothetical protein ATANTOWER_024380, partial [Ataeniobius toweri]|nr:hypothetical protein [Ataeniobius toweri]
VYRSLQQSYSISSQDILMAMDYCEESLQEIDITAFLQTLCGHIRVFSESSKAKKLGGGPRPATFSIGEVQEDQAEARTVMVNSCSTTAVEDGCEAKFKGKASQWTLDESKILSFPLTLLQTDSKCEVYPDLHNIIQVYPKMLDD